MCMQTAVAFIKKDFLNDISYAISFLTRWVGIIISVLTFYYLSKLMGKNAHPHLEAYGTDYFTFALVGLTAMSYLNAGLNGFAGTIAREQGIGTMEFFLSMPQRLSSIIFSCSLYNLIMGALSAGFYLFLGIVFFGAFFKAVNIYSVIVILGFATVCFLSLGMMAASCVIIFKRGDPITWIVTNFFWLFGGAYIPVGVFPQSLQTISFSIPTTYTLKALRLALCQGYSLSMLRQEIIALAAFSFGLLAVGLLGLKMAFFYARKKGTLAFH